MADPVGRGPREMEDGEERVSLFSLEVKVEGFIWTDSNGRKVYAKGRVINWDVEIGSFSFDMLMTSLCNAVKWGPTQSATVWYHDKRMNEDVRLENDFQMRDVFDMYKDQMQCQFIVGVFQKSLADSEFDQLEPICVVPPVDTQPEDIPQPEIPQPDIPQPEIPQPDIPQPDIPQPEIPLEPDVEPDREPDMFDNEEEYVGVDDEGLYMPVPPPTNNAQHSPSSNLQSPANPENDAAAKGGSPLEAEINDADPQEIHVIHDPENPKIAKGELFPDIVTFRKAIRHHAVKEGFELGNIITDKTRFIAHCAAEGCPWRIHASKIYDGKTIQIKVLPADHNCATTKLREGKMASQGWCADRLADWLKKNPTKGASACKEKIETDYGIKLKYSKAWSGMKVAFEKIHGKYEESFQLLFNWAAQIKQVSPGSFVRVEVETIGKKKRFRRLFVAFKPCVDGFKAGCRPFIGVDASSLNGKYRGQLASATGVDGHNWLYHIAFAIFDSETEDNWKWFLELLKSAIGDVPHLVICSDACKGLELAVGDVFPEAENRECMRHLYSNFMKQYSGDVFTEHLYPAARSYTQGLFQWHMNKIYEFAPSTIEYLEEHHSRIWYRCGFSENSKCDYLTNNVSESFNAQVKKFKGLLLHELVDSLRELIMEKRYLRRALAKQWADGILPNVVKELNTISNNLKVVKVTVSDVDIAEVTILDDWNNQRRHTVDLQNQKCSCREWQVTGKPCKHALAWILSNRGMKIEDFVHEYYSVARFRAAYEDRIEPIPDRTQWPVVNLGYKVYPPLLGRLAGRPKVQRIRSCLEKDGPKKKVRCKRCGDFGHFQKTCKNAKLGEDGERAPPRSKAKKRKAEQNEETEPGPSQVKKKKTQKEKKGTPKKKKTPLKKKQKKALANPPATVVSSLRKLLFNL